MSYGCGPTAVGSRASWAPGPLDRPLDRPRPVSAYDRIFSAFDRTNAFQCVERNSSERTVAHADIVVNRRVRSSLERADCALAAQSPAADEECRDKAAFSQQRQLYPLQEDLAEWINNTIGITYLTGENFLETLDNGVELCQLAAAIHDRAKEASDQGDANGPVPLLRGRCWQRAARRSFFSRDNTENFITFCRELGVHDNLLFESDDLVLHNQPRQVVLCLLEVARLATRYGVEPPGLVQLEREIALEEHQCATSWQFREASPKRDRSATVPPPTSPDLNEGDAVDNADAESTKSEGTVGSADSDVPLRPTNELDKRVQLVTRLMERGCSCGAGRCSKLLKVRKVGEGRYNIAGRNVFIRLLKGRHMMVRVGGGWDTLEHFLSRHEPCQVRLVAPGRRVAPSAPAERTPSPNASIASSKTSLETPAFSTSGKTSPVDVKQSVSTKNSPVDHRFSSGCKASASNSGKTSPVGVKQPASSGKTLTASNSGKTTPVETVDVKRQASSGKTSPVDHRPSSGSSKASDRTSPLRRSSATPKMTAKNRASLTLPLRTHSADIPTPNRTRKQSAPSFSTPTTPRTPTKPALLNAPKKSRSMSLALAPEKKTFCGTERLNQARSNSLANTPRSQSLASTPIGDPKRTFAKKTRSMSLAQPIEFKPLSNKSISVNITGPMTQAAIEESIRLSLAATIVDCNAPKKPFLHIKAKYRSPPPREVPPR